MGVGLFLVSVPVELFQGDRGKTRVPSPKNMSLGTRKKKHINHKSGKTRVPRPKNIRLGTRTCIHNDKVIITISGAHLAVDTWQWAWPTCIISRVMTNGFEGGLVGVGSGVMATGPASNSWSSWLALRTRSRHLYTHTLRRVRVWSRRTSS